MALPSAAQAAASDDPSAPTDRRRRPKTSFQPGTPTTDLDTQEINGVGQMVIDEKNGFIGLCTGTLITRAPSS